jgi:ankyrin repeat protein
MVMRIILKIIAFLSMTLSSNFVYCMYGSEEIEHGAGGSAFGYCYGFFQPLSHNSLIRAIQQKKPASAIAALIDANADINSHDSNWFPLDQAVFYRQVDTVRMLLEKKADVNFVCYNNSTALHTAAYIGNHEIVNMLIDNGAQVDIQEDDSGHTALMKSATKGYAEVVKILLEKGCANRNLKNKQEKTVEEEVLSYISYDILIFGKREYYLEVLRLIRETPCMEDVLVKNAAKLD